MSENFSEKHGFKKFKNVEITIRDEAPLEFRGVLIDLAYGCGFEPSRLRDLMCKLLRKRQQFPPNPSPLKYWIKEPKSTRFYAFPVCFLFFRRVVSMRFYPKLNSQA